jgi:polyhydroxyalkanoate synthase
MPVLNIYGRFDHLVPPEACNLLTSRVGSKDTQDICLETGHIGIYVSSRTQKELTPRIVQWLMDRDAIPAGKAEAEAETGKKTRRPRSKAIDMQSASSAKKRTR